MARERESAWAGRRLRRMEQQILADAALVAERGAANAPAENAAREAAFLDEVTASSRLAGFALDRSEVTALVVRGVAVGGKPLAAYEGVADYATAARLVAAADWLGPGNPRPFIRTDEVLELHRRACRRTVPAPGTWRDRNVAALSSGLVPPPHWLVPREIAAFVDKFGGGPAPRGPVLHWVAEAHARLLRVHPFSGGNGRVARLVANLLLRRCGLPPAAFGGRLEARYFPALAAADGGALSALAQLTGEAVGATLVALLWASNPDDALRPLRELAAPAELAALVKAAQRGRLRVLRRGPRVLSTAAWVDEYRRQRYSPSGKR